MDRIQASGGADASKTERLAIKAPAPRATQSVRTPPKRPPKIAPKRPAVAVGKMVPLPSAGPLWRE